jgi:hypothetical protein
MRVPDPDNSDMAVQASEAVFISAMSMSMKRVAEQGWAFLGLKIHIERKHLFDMPHNLPVSFQGTPF